MQKPLNYYCHKHIPQAKNITVGYEVIQKIGQGSFGEVYKVFDSRSCGIKVLKIAKQPDSGVKKEADILKEMSSSEGFARLTSIHSEDQMIMTLLGDSLERVVAKEGLSVITMKRMGWQIILRLSELHSHGYIHRDLKPQNILLGNRKQPHRVFVVDFGLASTFRKECKVARKAYSGEIGTVKYCSIASHNGLEQFPKDDLEGLGYVLVSLVRRQLPWSNISKEISEGERCKLIKEMKMKSTADGLSGGIGCLRKYLKYVMSLKIGEPVDYQKILSYFSVQCSLDNCYQFCPKDCRKKHIDQDQLQKVEDEPVAHQKTYHL